MTPYESIVDARRTLATLTEIPGGVWREIMTADRALQLACHLWLESRAVRASSTTKRRTSNGWRGPVANGWNVHNLSTVLCTYAKVVYRVN